MKTLVAWSIYLCVLVSLVMSGATAKECEKALVLHEIPALAQCVAQSGHSPKELPVPTSIATKMCPFTVCQNVFKDFGRLNCTINNVSTSTAVTTCDRILAARNPLISSSAATASPLGSSMILMLLVSVCATGSC